MGWKGKIVGKVGHYLSDSLGSPIKQLYSYASAQNADPRSTSKRHKNLPYVNTEQVRDVKRETDLATRDDNQENDPDTSITTLLLSLLSSSNASKPSGSVPEFSEKLPSDSSADACTSASLKRISEMPLPMPETLDDDVDSETEDGIICISEPTSPAHQFKLPPMSEDSLFLSESLRECIYSELPNIVKGRHWVMLYSTAKHGISLRTLYRRSSTLSEPFLLVAGDFHGVTFGGLVTAPLEPTSKRKYLGTSDTFVFTNVHGKTEIFKTTGANRYYVLCMNDAISFGGGGHYALHLHEDLLTGSSGACDTFGNCCLATSMEFSVANVEVWGFAHATRF